MKKVATLLLAIAAATTTAACGTDDVLRTVGSAGGDSGGGIAGAGGDTGIAGNEGSAGSGGGDGTGGASGAGGGNLGEVAAYLEIFSDFPEVYGGLVLQVGSIQVQAADRAPGGCSGKTAAVFGVPEGRLDITVRSEARFKWSIEAEVTRGECRAISLRADDSSSSFNFFGANSANGAQRLPVVITINGEFAEKLEKTFSLSDAVADPRAPESTARELFLRYVIEGQLFILPLNNDDVYPINLLARTSTGGTFHAPYTEPEDSDLNVHAF